MGDGTTSKTGTLQAAALFVLIGAEPYTDWLAAAAPPRRAGSC